MQAIWTFASVIEPTSASIPLLQKRPDTEPVLPDISDYQVLELLHKGGQGEIYKCVKKATRAVVAIKMPHEIRDQVSPYSRFAREIALLKALNHKHVLPILEIGEVEGRPWYSMDYVDGLSISDYCMIERLAPREIASLLAKVARTIAHVHSVGVLHRDLKPANILVDFDGNPWVIDFGLATCIGERNAEEQPLTGNAKIIGTARYMSPEQALDASLAGERSDIYSLGVVLAELVTGRTPYESESDTKDVLSLVRAQNTEDLPMRLRRRTSRCEEQQLDLPLRSIIETATRKRIVERYDSVTDFAEDLERYSHGDRGKTGPYHCTRKQVTRFCRRTAKPLATCGILMSIGALIAGAAGLAKGWPMAAEAASGAALQLAAMLKAGNLERNAGNLDEAVAACEYAITQAGGETSQPFRIVAYGSLEKKAQLYRVQGRTEEADALTEKAWTLLSEATSTVPIDDAWRIARANGYALRSDMYASRGEWETALDQARLAVSLHEALSDKESPKSTANRLQSRLKVANCLMNLGDVNAAYGLLLENSSDLNSHEFHPAAIDIAQVAVNIAAFLQSYPSLGAPTDFEFWYSCAETDLKNAIKDPSAASNALAIEKCLNAIERIGNQHSVEAAKLARVVPALPNSNRP